MNLRHLVALIVIGIGASFPSARADIVFSSGNRYVDSAATHAGSQNFASTIDGIFSNSATSSGSGSAGTFSGSATQNSNAPISGAAMTGTGGVASAIGANGSEGYATRGDSFFDVFFTVDVAGSYDFSATVSWSGPTPIFGSMTNPDNLAIVELRNHTTSSQLVVAYQDFLDQGTDSALSTLTLNTGVTYRVRAQSIVSGAGGASGVYNANSSWGFTLAVAVPETGSAALMTAAMLAAIGGVWLRRRRISAASAIL